MDYSAIVYVRLRSQGHFKLFQAKWQLGLIHSSRIAIIMFKGDAGRLQSKTPVIFTSMTIGAVLLALTAIQQWYVPI